MDFKGIVKEQREELEQIEREERIVERDGLGEAKKLLARPNILAILGVRRCGKSVFSYLLAKGGKAGYVNFDDERLAGVKTGDLNRVLEAFYALYGDVEYVVLDEVQNVGNWELFASRLRRTKRVVLTGSNSRLLSGELATHLTGRHVDVELFPFSFREFLRLKQFPLASAYTTREKAELLNLLNEYLETGGFPEAYKFGKAIVARTYDDIVTKDVLLRYKIKKAQELKMLASYLVTNACGEHTYSKLAKTVGVKHVSTISKWAAYLENAFLLFKLERFDFKLKQQFIAPKKVYCIDTGIINAVGFRFSENKGKLLENAVAVELKRRKAREDATDLYYWKNHAQNEVDFVVKKGKTISHLLQATYATAMDEVKDRELKSLLKAARALKCGNLNVITWDLDSEKRFGGKKIRFTPLWKWLLEDRKP